MRMLYDTTMVHPLDRYDYYRAGAACEVAPVQVHGRAPGRLVATMSLSRIGEFDLEQLTWQADTQIMARRTARLIRVGDPQRYRLALAVAGGVHSEQADNRVRFGPGDIGLFDLSRPWRTVHPAGASVQVLMLSFPRTMLPLPERALRPVLGTLLPRRLRARELMARLLVGLPAAAEPADHADVLFECALGLIRRRLGLPDEITPRTRRLVYLIRVREVIRRHLADPQLDVDHIARASHLSTRYLHKLFEDTEVTPMQLVKRMRLEECRRRLANPALQATPVATIAAACGYRRPDQFARDFRHAFGVTPTDVRGTRTRGQEAYRGA